MRVLGALAGLAALFLGIGAAATEEGQPYAVTITGPARIIDGDTIEIKGERIRLAGIDAPEMDQVCQAADGTDWACGVAARDYLANLTLDRPVNCEVNGFDRYGRALALCWLMSEDGRAKVGGLNGLLVINGWAVRYRGMDDYWIQEDVARDLKLGVWAGPFMLPWEWRQRAESDLA